MGGGGTPFKDLRIKNSTQDWFDDQVAKAIKLREKRLKQFKSTTLHIDEDLFLSKISLLKVECDG